MALPNDGFWYQPASLWSIAYVDASAEVDSIRFNFKREHFRNPTRHPITINRFALNGVNYPVDIMNVSTSELQSVANSAILNQATIAISAPYRKNYSRMTIPLAAYAPRPTGWVSGSTLSDSSLFGTNYLHFDKPILLPRKGALEVALTGMTSMISDCFGADPADNIEFPILPLRRGRFYYHEVGGLFSGSSRQKGLLVISGENVAPIPDPYSGIPFAVPPGYDVFSDGGTVPVELWPPESRMTARDFEQQESTRSGSSQVYGMGVFIEQIDWDDDIKAQFLAKQATAAGRDYKIAMMASRLGCRARATHAPGSNDWWWRPGAPLCLVMDTITDALVYDLPQPITLSQGETLDVTMFVPGATAAAAGPGYQVGISFNGWTSVEG
jgi:hypothetical protein